MTDPLVSDVVVRDEMHGTVTPADDPAPAASAPVAAAPAPARWIDAHLAWVVVVAVVVVALCASATSLGNQFAYDDRWIISNNARVKDISRWWKLFGESYWPVLSMGLYRPLTSLGYMLQWWAGGGKPWIFHLVNVLAYTGGCVMALRLAGRTVSWPYALAAAALFAAHPVHVEAVGNIVGQAEVFCFLFLALGVERYVAWRNDGTLGADARRPAWGRIAVLGLIYVVASLYKEQGIVLPGLLVAAELTVVRETRGLRARLAAVRAPVIAMALLTALLLVVRIRILGEFSGDVPHPVIEHLPASQRTVGMLGLVPEVLRLLLFPASLSADYGPSHTIFVTKFGVEAFQGLLMLVVIAAVTIAAWRHAPAVAFGVLWAAMTYAPVSNVVFPSGILIAERTLFAPSFGVVLALAALVEWGVRAGKVKAPELRLVAGVAAALVVAGTAFSAVRQPVWKNNERLFNQMVKDAPLSARAHVALGGHLFEQRRNAEAERQWRIGILLDSATMRIRTDLADQYSKAAVWGPAVELYRQVIARDPGASRSRAGLVRALVAMGYRDEALHVALAGFAYAYDAGDLQLMRRLLAEVRAPKAPAAPDAPPQAAPAGGATKASTAASAAGVTIVTPPPRATAPGRG